MYCMYVFHTLLTIKRKVILIRLLYDDSYNFNMQLNILEKGHKM